MQKSDFSVSGVKTFRGNEGEGYNATVKYKGKKVAFVMDDASGGPAQVEWEASGASYLRRERTPLEQEILQFVESLPPRTIEGFTIKYDIELFFEDLVNEYLDNRELRKECRRKILYRDDKGDIFALSVAPPITPAIREKIRQWGGVEVINDRFERGER